MTDASTMPDEAKKGLKLIEETARKGFNLEDRLKNRGLRRGSIVLYLDDEIGPEIGWAYDLNDPLGNKIGRNRAGVIGKLDAMAETREGLVAKLEAARATVLSNPDDLTRVEAEVLDANEALDAEEAPLKLRRDELMHLLELTGLTVEMRAVPPIIQKDCRRLARETMGLTEKNIPEDRKEEYDDVYTAHIMAVVIQSIKDNETGGVIGGEREKITYQQAVNLRDYLPDGQYQRLSQKIAEIQFSDAVSRTIESQEDFS